MNRRSALPGLVNREGNVLAIMPHPERDAWTFNHPDRRRGDDMLAPSGGAVLFRSFVEAVTRHERRAPSPSASRFPTTRRTRRSSTLRRLGVEIARRRAQRDRALFDAPRRRATLVAARSKRDETIFNPNKHRVTVLDADAPRAGEVWIVQDGTPSALRRLASLRRAPGVPAGRRRAARRPQNDCSAIPPSKGRSIQTESTE